MKQCLITKQHSCPDLYTGTVAPCPRGGSLDPELLLMLVPFTRSLCFLHQKATCTEWRGQHACTVSAAIYVHELDYSAGVWWRASAGWAHSGAALQRLRWCWEKPYTSVGQAGAKQRSITTGDAYQLWPCRVHHFNLSVWDQPCSSRLTSTMQTCKRRLVIPCSKMVITHGQKDGWINRWMKGISDKRGGGWRAQEWMKRWSVNGWKDRCAVVMRMIGCTD